ncbi:MAG: ribbon-helix-helix protein, CopG family, partial [Ruminococcus sp.]|nr:ribbon-helix-helix protein, CopG family [Ruminococcus sp.]
MQKSVYSIVLSDDVVAQIDRLAYRHNTNRSNMINQILAEYVSYVTPEKRMQDTFARMES